MNRNKIRKLYDKYEKNIANKIRRELIKYFNEQIDRLAKHVRNKINKKDVSEDDAQKQADNILKDYNIENDIKELQVTMFPLLYTAGELGNDLANIRLYAGEGDYQIFSIIEKRYLTYLRSHGLTLAKEVNKTTMNRTRRIIAKGLIKGQSYDEIAKNIQATKKFSYNRARTIAETEVHTSFMVTRDLNAKSGGFKEKHWMDSDDASVRPTHRRYDNMGWVKFDYVYDNDVSFPGDPKGSPKNVIRCRCEISYR